MPWGAAVRAGCYGYADLQREPEGFPAGFEHLSRLARYVLRGAEPGTLLGHRRVHRHGGHQVRSLLSHPLDGFPVQKTPVLYGVHAGLQGVVDRLDGVGVGRSLAPEKPAVTAGHGDGPARGYHSWTAEDPQLHGAADLDRQTVCGADVPYGCDAGTQVEGCVVGAAQNRQGARLTFDRLVGLGGSVPHQMHVRIYQTWHERYVAEVHRLRVGGEPACRAHRGDAAIFDDDRAVFDHPFRGSVENANCTIGYRHVTPLSTLSLLELGTGRLLYRGDRDQGRDGRGYQVEGRREGVTGQGDQVRCEERRRPPEDGDRDVVAYRETAVAYAGREELRQGRDGRAQEHGEQGPECHVREHGAHQITLVHKQEERVGEQRETDARRRQKRLPPDAVGEGAKRRDQGHRHQQGEHGGEGGCRAREAQLLGEVGRHIGEHDVETCVLDDDESYHLEYGSPVLRDRLPERGSGDLAGPLQRPELRGIFDPQPYVESDETQRPRQ